MSPSLRGFFRRYWVEFPSAVITTAISIISFFIVGVIALFITRACNRSVRRRPEALPRT